MPKPAARLADLTQHGGVIMPPCATKTMIEMLPAARLTDMHTCPMVTVLVPHVGGPIIMGSPTVLIEFLPAARVMDQLVCVGPPDMIAMGAQKTMIGDGGGGGGGGAGGGGAAMATMPATPSASTPALPSITGGGGAGAPLNLCTAAGHPVDVATGRMFTQAVDFRFGPLPFTRLYSSITATSRGTLGPGWTHVLDERLVQTSETIVYHTAEGRTVLFPRIPEGDEFLLHIDEKIVLRRTSAGYAVEQASGRKLVFEHTVDGASLYLSAVHDDATVLAIDRSGILPGSITDKAGNRWTLGSDDGVTIGIVYYTGPGTSQPRLQARYTYDDKGRLGAVTDAVGNTWRYFYDHLNRLTQETGRNGVSFYFEYDVRHRCVRTWGDGGLLDVTFAYSDEQSVTVVRDAEQRPTRYEYNDLGVVTRVVDTLGYERTHEYEGLNQVKTTDSLGRVTEYAYDLSGRVIGVTSPGGSKTLAQYQQDGTTVLTAADGSSVRTTPRHDQTAVSAGDGDPPPAALVPARDPIAAMVSRQLRAGLHRRHVRIPGLRLRTATGVDHVHDARGNLTAVVDQTGALANFDYDALDRLARIGRADGSRIQFHYDAEGNLSHYTDGNGHTSRFQYGALGRLSAATNGAGEVTRFEHDKMVRLCKVIDGRLSETRFDYDPIGRIQRILYPDGQSDQFMFDPSGQLLRLVGRGGIGSDFVYDPDGRMTSMTYNDGLRLQFAYNAKGKITTASNGTSRVSFAYDGLGRLIREEQSGETVEYTYGNTGLLETIAMSNGRRVEYGYGIRGRLISATDWAGGRHSFTYSNAGRVIKHAFPNGLTASYVNSGIGLPVEVTLKRPDAERPLAWTRYRYDAADAVTELSDTDRGTIRYHYDAAGRVTTADHGNARLSEAFSYDAAGNIIGYGAMQIFSYDACNRLQGAPNLRCRYDNRGNTIEIEDAAHGRRQLQYNGQGLVTSIVLPDDTVAQYDYDAFGRRIRKSHRGADTRYVWAGNQMIAEITTGAREETCRYLYLPNSFTPLAMQINEECYCFHTDHRDTPVRVTNARAEVVWLADYSAYGSARIRTAAIEQPLRMPGQYYDVESGLHYNRSRYYSPQIGRYLSPDPLGLDAGLNLYVYANNDPINQTDPLGMDPDDSDAPADTTLGANGQNGKVTGSNPTPAPIATPPSPPAPPAPASGGGCAVSDAAAAASSQAPADTAATASAIANGHAFEKHVAQEGQFANVGVTQPQDFANHINNVMQTCPPKPLAAGRSAHYDKKSNTLVIVDPSSPDGGTCFQPAGGQKYIDRLK